MRDKHARLWVNVAPNHAYNFHQIVVHAAVYSYGRSSAILRWRCDMLCISRFTCDDVFSHCLTGRGMSCSDTFFCKYGTVPQCIHSVLTYTLKKPRSSQCGFFPASQLPNFKTQIRYKAGKLFLKSFFRFSGFVKAVLGFRVFLY